MSRRFVTLELTGIEVRMLLETIDYRFREADRKNMSGIPPERKDRKGKFLILQEVRRQLETLEFELTVRQFELTVRQ